MASKFTPQALMATRLIKAKGRPVTFTRKDGGTYEPVTQTRTGGATKTITMNAVGLPAGKSAEYRVGELVNRNIIELHCAPNLGPVPDKGDTVEFQGKVWTVIWIEELNPDGAGAVYAKAYLER